MVSPLKLLANSGGVFVGIQALFLGIVSFIVPKVFAEPTNKLSLEDWIPYQVTVSVGKVLQNTNPANGRPGATIASPQDNDPNYVYHWVRDSALTYQTLLNLYVHSSGSQKSMYRKRLLDYVGFSSFIQSKASLGKAKFEITGEPYGGATPNPNVWCEPQNDGPALRAITLLEFAKVLEDEGQKELVKSRLYPVIQRDIDYIMQVWQEPSCDLWEEVYGYHFFTRAVQRKALLLATKGSSQSQRDGAAMKNVAAALERHLLGHWDDVAGFYRSSFRTGGLSSKTSNIDSSFVLAVIHGNLGDGFLSFTDDRVLKTVDKTYNAFSFYPVNRRTDLGPAIGRYPEDTYYGGNPWVLLTAAVGQFYERCAQAAQADGDNETAKMCSTRSASLLARLKFHAPADGSFSEQIDKESGFMKSARDLTWSHTEFLDFMSVKDLL